MEFRKFLREIRFLEWCSKSFFAHSKVREGEENVPKNLTWNFLFHHIQDYIDNILD